MSNINVGNWFTERKKFNFQELTVEGYDFQLVPLDDELIEDVKAATTLNSALALAAEYGLSVGRDRIFNDDDMAADLDVFWGQAEVNSGDPSIKHQVGEYVCNISGLAEHIQIVREVEKEAAEAEEARIKVGDHLLDGREAIDNLNDESLAQDAAVIDNTL